MSNVIQTQERLTVEWLPEEEAIQLTFQHGKGAPHVETWSEEPDLHDISATLELWQLQTGLMTAPEIMAVINAAASVETWLETIPYDLAHYGEIGVSY